MTETGETGQTAKEQTESACKRIKQGLEDFVNMFLPPEEATKHFREARIEVLRGFRAILDARIERLSRSGAQGTRVTVE
ncbi:MAG TPA: hypothetical protein VHZ07_17035 [Bryobacteraceae bacterium]|jgi:hypothetical protein|nr:hypothetical protein [Bryobacteraceae bacterium]